MSSSSIVTNPSSNKSSKEGTGCKYNEAGHGYHGNADSKYVLPNYDDEKDRLHEQHWILRYALQRNYFAHVTKVLEEGITVLDSGCGPAIWTFESHLHTQNFMGHAISQVFPEQIKPANVELVIGTENLYRVLKPGGYIELTEACDTNVILYRLDMRNYVNKGPIFTELQRMINTVFAVRGFPKDLYKQLEGRLVKAGFVNQDVQVTPLPINHGGKAGELFWMDGRHAYPNVRPAFAKTRTEWEDIDVFERDMDICSAEAI